MHRGIGSGEYEQHIAVAGLGQVDGKGGVEFVKDLDSTAEARGGGCIPPHLVWPK